jgi:MFS family permease
MSSLRDVAVGVAFGCRGVAVSVAVGRAVVAVEVGVAGAACVAVSTAVAGTIAADLRVSGVAVVNGGGGVGVLVGVGVGAVLALPRLASDRPDRKSANSTRSSAAGAISERFDSIDLFLLSSWVKRSIPQFEGFVK